jgi:hypothetical protein
MRFAEWWHGLSRAYQNALTLLIVDCVLLVGALTRLRPLHLTWDAATWNLPNIYEAILLQLIALVRDVAPGASVASSVAVIYGTLLLSLLTMHVVVGFGIGFLFDKLPRTHAWTFVNYFVLIVVLLAVHVFLLFSGLPPA